MDLPKKQSYTLILKAMKVDLKVSKASNIVCMSNCPKAFESSCGIAYRSW